MPGDEAADGGRSGPDPTSLTTDQLRREVAGLRELVATRFDGLVEVIEARFRKVDQEFGLVERQRVEQKADTKAAVDAALTAQKEAVREQTIASERAIAKSEAGTTKQLEQLGANFVTAISGVTNVLADLKDRVGRIESVRVGGQQERVESRQVTAASIALVGLIVTTVVAALTIIAFLAAR